MIHPVWPGRSGEEIGAGTSPGQQLPAALPWLHHSVTLLANGAPAPPVSPSLVSSKLLQSAQALIGLGQVSAIHFNHGASTCQIIPSVSVCDCMVVEWVSDLGLCVNSLKDLFTQMTYKYFTHPTHLTLSSHSLGFICFHCRYLPLRLHLSNAKSLQQCQQVLILIILML